MLAESNNEFNAEHSIDPMSSDQNDNYNRITSSDKFKLERKRFVILALFLLCTSTNGFQWIQYSVIGTEMIFFYNSSIPQDQGITLIAMTTIIYMITYTILVLPATYILNRYGLRIAFLLGSFINAFGTLLKCLAISPDKFALAMVGQTVASTAQIFTLGNPSLLAALWFSEKYISTVAAIGVFGNQAGIALGFLIPSELISKVTDAEVIALRLKIIMYTLLVIETAVFLLAVPFFKDRPKTPPSRAQANNVRTLMADIDMSRWQNGIKQLLKDKNFLLLFVTYGTLTGVFYAISTNLYLYYEKYFPEAEAAAGRSGLIMILAGMLGSICAGIVLDKTGAYKAVSVGTCLISLLSAIAFSVVLMYSLSASYFLSFVLGTFMTGYLPIGFEIAAEMTYPVSEGLSSALINVSAQVFGIVLIFTQVEIIERSTSKRVLESNIYLCAWLVIGSLSAMIMKVAKRRTLANTNPTMLAPMPVLHEQTK